MSIEVTTDRIFIRGRCGVEEAEPLLEALTEAPGRIVVLEADRLHTALWQVLIARKPVIEGQPKDAFVIQHLIPLVLEKTAEARLATSASDAQSALAQTRSGANQ